MTQNSREAAVIDPILSTQARGYTNAEMVGLQVLPEVDIPNRSMKVLRFGKEDFRKRDTRRAPGSETAVVNFGFTSDPVALKQEALMVRRGWGHADLMAMLESEFCFWLREQIDWDEAEAEARRAAAERAARS